MVSALPAALHCQHCCHCTGVANKEKDQATLAVQSYIGVPINEAKIGVVMGITGALGGMKVTEEQVGATSGESLWINLRNTQVFLAHWVILFILHWLAALCHCHQGD